MRLGHRTWMCGLVSLGLLYVGCGKKDDSDDVPTGRDSLPEHIRPAEGQSAMSLASSLIVGSLAKISALPAYGESSSYTASLTAADELTIDTADKWANQQTFNCFGECPNEGSIAPKTFVAQALNEDAEFSPVERMKQSIGTFCVMGHVFTADQLDNFGMPNAMARAKMTLSEAQVAAIESECEQEIPDALELYTTVVDIEGNAFYNKKITFEVSGEESQNLETYMKYSADTINFQQFTPATEESGAERAQFVYNVGEKVFSFEYASVRYGDSFADKSFNLFRTAIDETSGEVRFTSVMGSSPTENLTFLAVSGNSESTVKQAGAFFHRVDTTTSVNNQFVCFDKKTGDFINKTGCTETEGVDRKVTHNNTSKSFTSLAAWTASDWKGDETVAPVVFGIDTITSVEVSK